MYDLTDISNGAILKVRAAMVIGPSNQAADIERTAGWAASADAANFDLLSEELKLIYLYRHQSIGDGIYAVKDAVSAIVAKAGNCGYMASLALKFIAEDPKFIGMTAKRKYFGSPFQHTFVELSDGENIVYCDPWLGLTFDGSQNSIITITNQLIKIENDHVDRLRFILQNSKFEYFIPFDIDDTESIDQSALAELERNFASYCYNNTNWACLQVSQALTRQEDELKKLLNFSSNVTDASQYLQNDAADSYHFILSDTNKTVFLDLFELFYLLELQAIYPNSTELYTKICSRFEQMKTLQADGEYAEEAVTRFLKWQQDVKPSIAKPITPLLENLRKQQSASSIIPVTKEYCGFERRFFSNSKNGLFHQ